MRLILVRHASVTVQPECPSSEWHLSPEGRAAAAALADDLLWVDISVLHASPEPKAIGTAQRIAAPHGLQLRIERDLREVERGWSDSYREDATRYLSGEEIAGWEPRHRAQARMRETVDRLDVNDRNAAFVSHGLALTILLGDLVHLDAGAVAEMWSKTQFPDVAIVDTRSGRLERGFGEGMAIEGR